MDASADFYSLQPTEAPREMEEIAKLLHASDLELDSQVEVFVVCRRGGSIVACAGLDHYVIKCVAVAQTLRGNSLSLRLGSEVTKLAAERGYFHLFLYSAPRNQQFFRGWGFYPLVEVPQRVVLMENSPVALNKYRESLRKLRRPGRKIGSIVLNANPFTLGHRYLVEQAAAACDWLHVFVVGEDSSLLSYTDRFTLVQQGIRHIDNLTLHRGSNYIISRATFPGYFLKDQGLIQESWCAIDLLLFREAITPPLGITHRYVGSEPFDAVTRAYNADMRRWLQEARCEAAPIAVVEIPRLAVHSTPISASQVRNLWIRHELAKLKELVPETTWRFLERSDAPVMNTH